MLKKSREELRRLMELRRSSASSPVKNKRKYRRGVRNKSRQDQGE